MREEILCIGDAMVDVIVELGEEINIGSDTQSKISMIGGGAAANTACWLGSQKEAVRFVGKVGSDAAGKQFISDLDSFGVSHNDLCSDGAHTGMVVVLVDKNGERTMFPDSGANSSLSLKDLPDLNQFKAAYFSGYALVNPISRANAVEILKTLTMPVVIDPGTVGALRNIPLTEVKSWLSFASVLILNEEEAKFISEKSDVTEALTELKKIVDTVVIKLGGKGAIAMADQICEVEIKREEPVDTTGAGDAFAAGFISSWFANHDLKDAINHGAELARKCIANVGAWPVKQ